MYASSRFFSDMQKRKKGYKKVGNVQKQIATYHLFFLHSKCTWPLLSSKSCAVGLFPLFVVLFPLFVVTSSSTITVILAIDLFDIMLFPFPVENLLLFPVWLFPPEVELFWFPPESNGWFSPLTAGGEPGTKVISSDSRGFIVTVKVGISKVGKACKKM